MATRLADDGLSFRDSRVDDDGDARPIRRRLRRRGRYVARGCRPALRGRRRDSDPPGWQSGPETGEWSREPEPQNGRQRPFMRPQGLHFRRGQRLR